MPLCDNSRPPIGTWGNMISLTELLYEEIINLGENDATLKIYLYQQFKENIQKVIKHPQERKFFIDICDRIIACYSRSNASNLQ